MHDAALRELKKDHGTPPDTGGTELRTRLVVGLTAAMMVGEIAVGAWSGSLALFADGWHMGTHAGAIGLAAAAYWFARTRADSPRFTFGTGKVHALAAWTNAILLTLGGLWMIVDGIWRLANPVEIGVREALPVAVLGLLVNVVSAWLLSPGASPEPAPVKFTPIAVPMTKLSPPRIEHGHDHGHDHAPVKAPGRPVAHAHGYGSHGHSHGHDDLTGRSAYLHVLADLLTSVLAIVALILAGALGWWWADPLVGLLGAAMIVRWGGTLLRESGGQLLDLAPSDEDVARIRDSLERIDDVRVADLHVWEMGYGRRAGLVVLVTDHPRPIGEYRRAVQGVTPIEHLTIEINRCPHPCKGNDGEAA